MQTKDEILIILNKHSEALGPAWKPCVWENLGWHISWENGAFTLYYSSDDKKFSVLIGGHSDFHDAHKIHRRDPLMAIRLAAQCAQNMYRTKWMPIIGSIETILRS